MFPGHRFGGGALAVYLDGQPVVDVWKGWADRDGKVPWSADSAPMVFSATKGMAATVIHRLADRGLIDYDAPVAEYWHSFGANGKANMTVREVMKHTAGLSGLRGAKQEELLDHVLMEERLAAASPGRLLGKPAYHALTFGWLMSGLARAVTGKDMRVLFREETAATFGASIVNPTPGTPEGPWLRTGDSGFYSEGELFILGRIKDLLIVYGRNHSPDDIEATIQTVSPGRCVAIAVPQDGVEKLVTIIELKQKDESPEEAAERFSFIKREVTSAISKAHGLSASDIVLVAQGSIPITTSGKPRRAQCGELYRRGEFVRLDA
ncbi:serine hydrolase [Mycobacterium sp. Z3061]|uniref:serine hydrolase n=1 Tax=Mycobacterium sp. Z3061 TaxID=3073562 RepID=UPI0037C9F4E4